MSTNLYIEIKNKNNDDKPSKIVGMRLDLAVFDYLKGINKDKHFEEHNIQVDANAHVASKDSDQTNTNRFKVDTDTSKDGNDINNNSSVEATINTNSQRDVVNKIDLSNLSRSIVSNNIDKLALVNGNIEKRGYKIRKNDVIKVNLGYLGKIIEKSSENVSLNSGVYTIVPQRGDIKIIYEDKDIIVIDKKAGVSVHPGIGNPNNTLANYVRYYLEEKSEFDVRVINGGLVHRLDKCTSGLIIFAKNLEAQDTLKRFFKDRKVKKGYLAKVKESITGISPIYLGGYIKRDKIDRRRMKYIPLTTQKIDISRSVDILGDVEYEALEDIVESALLPGKNCSTDQLSDDDNKFNRPNTQLSRQNPSKGIYSDRNKEKRDNKCKFCETFITPVSDDTLLVYPKTGRNHQIRAVLRELGLHITNDSLYISKRAGEIPDEIGLKCIYICILDYNTGLEVSLHDYKLL